MKDMTRKEAEAEAVRRGGTGGTIRFRPTNPSKNRGRLARYSCVVSSGAGYFPATEGQGDTWNAAFADARPRLSPCGGTMNRPRRIPNLPSALLVSALFGSELRAEVVRVELISRVPVAAGRA